MMRDRNLDAVDKMRQSNFYPPVSRIELSECLFARKKRRRLELLRGIGIEAGKFA